jgi:hypothetical protein
LTTDRAAQDRLGEVVEATRKVFVGSSSEATALARRVSEVIEDAGMTPTVWNLNSFPPGRTLVEQIDNLPCEFDAAVLLATPDLSCQRGSRSFRSPAPNIVFEYGYLSARLTRHRVALLRLLDADMPSDLLGVKVIEDSRTGYLTRRLPARLVDELRAWLGRLPKLASDVHPTLQLHGYSGTWRIENNFDLWRGFQVQRPDSIYFDGRTTLFIPANGRGGSGMMFGTTYLSVGGYHATIDVVNEVMNAAVSATGELTLRIQVLRRNYTQDGTFPLADLFHDEPRNTEFDVRLNPADSAPKELHGMHTFTRATEVYSSARERYVQIP